MKIPERIRDLLKDHHLYPCVIQSINEFKPLFANERPDFFPEYTNHGISHIEVVFQTAEALINDQSWDVLTPMDAATILLAILLHDSAIHLTPDSFVALLNKCDAEYIIGGLDKQNWTKLWDDFLAEASRFDGRKLTAIFGSPDPIHPPPLDPNNMNLRNIKLIGEFLRRYHHRLAHQIAIFGVPSPTSERLTLQNIPEDIADLAGLVARSHGMPLRQCINYLNEKYKNKCEHRGIHTVFIMALLRVADYLHINAERAPKQVFKITTLRSPLSKGHYNLHNAIRDVRFTHPDPETIDVNAIPSDVDTFLRTRKLLDDIQFELDSTWAILGEIYGRMTSNKLNLLGLKFRRICSNLDDIDTFAKTVNYIPCKAAFDSAGADLLKLLIKPLYGDNPSFGIRELIQNSVDAVRERWEYEKRHNLKIYDFSDHDVDVILSLNEDENGDLWFTISDKGIGMTSDTLRNYFLLAGASFRNSDTWKKEFTNNQGRSRVFRSGRFGIGVLAALLIGDEIEVITRHVSANPDEAIQFTSTLDAESVELHRTSGYVGTSTRIKVHKEISLKYYFFILEIDKLVHEDSFNNENNTWHYLIDWYSCEKPSLKCFIKGKHAPSRFMLPSPNFKLPPEWRVFKTEEFPAVYWSYIASSPSLSCNGLTIETKNDRSFYNYTHGHQSYIYDDSFIAGSYFEKPAISVFDPDARLPLSLDRTHLMEDLPFSDKLKYEIIKDFLAYILIAGPSAHMSTKKGLVAFQRLKYAGGGNCRQEFSGKVMLDDLFSTLDGFSFAFSQNVDSLNMDSCILVSNMHYGDNTALVPIVNSTLFFLISSPGLISPPRLAFTRFTLNAVNVASTPDGAYGIWPSVRGARIVLPLKEVTQMRKPRNLKKTVRSKILIEDRVGKWALCSLGECSEPSMDLMRIYKSLSQKNPDDKVNYGQSAAEWYFHPFTQVPIQEIEQPIPKAWREIIRETIIPYDPDERRKKLSYAFEELSPYIEAHEELLRRKKKDKRK